jgi:peptidoglycan/xylan/chitin deacetylase (PgdA/CDA1 family)
MNMKLSLLTLAKNIGIFALFRRLTKSSPRILCYHGGSVGDEHLFNGKLFCEKGLLDQRLRWLQRNGFVPISLDELFQAKTARPQGIPVVVTLDDGWYSSATDLLPVLARHNHRPVLYLATKVFAGGGPVIDVCVRYILWKSPLKSAKLSGFSAEVDGDYDFEAAAERARFCAAAEKWLATQGDEPLAQTTSLERLSVALGVPSDVLDLSSRRFSYMSREELHVAARQGCSVELHGHVHRYVKGEVERNRADIETCRQHIVAAGFPSPRHYCYPSGDYDQKAALTMAAVGVRTATTCLPGLVHDLEGNRRYFLPRFLDGASVTNIEFEAEMSGVLEFVRNITGRLRLR